MSNVMEIMQTKMQEEVEQLQSLQKQQTKTLTARQTLDSQLSENKLVTVEDDANVYKLVGPALVRQEATEARSNVDKRIGYITGELKRHDDLLKDLEKKQEQHKENLQALQTQMQKLAQA